LKKMGVYDDTLILYMGDNGFMFGEHGLIDKRVAYDASIRIPMLMQCPSLFSGGRTVEQAVANIDVGPTIMTAMGLTPPPHMDGLNFLPLARGTSTSWRDNFLYVYYWEKNFPQSPTVFALRNDRYKFITYYGLWDLDELYDLQADPGETKNLFHDPAHRATAKRWRPNSTPVWKNSAAWTSRSTRPKAASTTNASAAAAAKKARTSPPP
jgi:N-acetylglucosamine-6-sulfatase